MTRMFGLNLEDHGASVAARRSRNWRRTNFNLIRLRGYRRYCSLLLAAATRIMNRKSALNEKVQIV